MTPEAWEQQSNDILDSLKTWEFPVAICCGTDYLPAINVFQENGIKIPEELAYIITTDETSYIDDIKPSLSSVHCNFTQVGFRAGEMLHKIFNNETIEEHQLLLKPKEIIPRESTDSYAIDDEIIKDTLRFINDNIHKNIRIDDITNHVNISYSALQKRFKESIGHSIKHEIDRVRIIQAKRLLSNLRLKINEVHTQTGFSSALNLRRVFYKATGMTPTEYRHSLSEVTSS